jgi:hypothetical protein
VPSNAVINGAFGRLRVIAATFTVFLMLAIAEEAMAAGRRARDGMVVSVLGSSCDTDVP